MKTQTNTHRQPGTHVPQNRVQLVCERMLDTRSHWTDNERDQRARWARERQAELFTLLAPAVSAEPEIWAVGAATAADIARLEN